MRVKRLRLESYGPFEDSDWLELSPSMNIFVGENNAGKSAVLRSFQTNLTSVPHRNNREWRSEYLKRPLQTVEIEYSGSELEQILRKMPSNGGGGWYLALPELGIVPLVEEYCHEEMQLPSTLHLMNRPTGAQFLSVEPVETNEDTNLFLFYFQEGQWLTTYQGVAKPANGIASILSKMWAEKVFFFQALRSSPGKMTFGSANRLDENAARLAVELNGMQGDSPELFKRLVSHLTTIFPTVGNLSVSSAQGQLEIRVWATREQVSRELSFSLDDSGTGIAQALAILFIAMTLERAVLVIDEIGSYLHPAAAKALLRILQTTYPEHQYIVSTHSPEVLSAGRDAKVFWVRKLGFESSIQNVDLHDLRVLREVTGRLGVSMTDVFAAEHIIWVDGETEEACFPMLLSASGDDTRSVQFIAVLHTGDFQEKGMKPEKVFKVYERLTSATAPVVSKVAFNFDSDALTAEKKADLSRRSGGRIHFLPRVNFESYLLNPASIARVVLKSAKELQTPELLGLETRIEEALNELAADKRYGRPASPPSFSDPHWLEQVDGAKLIAELFQRVTDHTLEYRKTTHSVALVRDMLENEPNALADLKRYVVELVAIAKA